METSRPPVIRTRGYKMNQELATLIARLEALSSAHKGTMTYPSVRKERPVKVSRPKISRIKVSRARVSRRERVSKIAVRDREFVYERDEGRCFYCHCDVTRSTAHMDHVLPLSRGGMSTISNLVLSCSKCNVHKCDSILENLSEVLAEVRDRNNRLLHVLSLR
jgi:5-methylcytosine-specific restriction endonuclease McrA